MAAGVCKRPVRVPPRALGEISIMTNSTRLIGLVMTAALWAGVAAAQGMTGPAAGDAWPPNLPLPSPGAESLPPPAGQTPNPQAASPSDATQPAGSTDG